MPLLFADGSADNVNARLFIAVFLSVALIVMYMYIVQPNVNISSKSYNNQSTNSILRNGIPRNRRKASAGETLCSYLRANPNEPDIIVYNRMPKAGSSTMQILYSSLSKTNNFTRWETPPSFWGQINVTQFERDVILYLNTIDQRQLVIDGHWFQRKFNSTLLNRNIEYVQLIRDSKSWIKSWIFYTTFNSLAAFKARENNSFDEYIKQKLNLNHSNYHLCFEDYNCLRNANIGFDPDSLVPYVCGESCSELINNSNSSSSSQAMLPTLNNPDAFVSIGVLSHLEKYLHVLECAYPNVLKGILDLFLSERTHANISSKLNNTKALLDFVNGISSRAVSYNKMYDDVENILLDQYEYLKQNKDTCCRKQRK